MDAYKKLVDACAMPVNESGSVFVKLAPAWQSACAIVLHSAASGCVTAVRRRHSACVSAPPRLRTAVNQLFPDAPSAARPAVNLRKHAVS